MKKLLSAIIFSGVLLSGTAGELRLTDATGGVPLTAVTLAAMHLSRQDESNSISLTKSLPSQALSQLDSGRTDAVIIDHRFAGKRPQIPLAADAMAVYASTGNPVMDISAKEIREIITSPRPTWKKYINRNEDIQRIALKPDRPGGTLLHRISGSRELPGEIFQVSTPGSGFAFMNSASLFFANFRSLPPDSSKVKAIKIDGVYPAKDNIISGKYPLALKYVIVFKKEHPLLKKLIKVMMQDAFLQKQMENSGLLPLFPETYPGE